VTDPFTGGAKCIMVYWSIHPKFLGAMAHPAHSLINSVQYSTPMTWRSQSIWKSCKRSTSSTYTALSNISISCLLIPVTMRRQRRRQSSCLAFSGRSLAASAADELGQQFYHRSPDGSSNATAVLRPKSITSVSP